MCKINDRILKFETVDEKIKRLGITKERVEELKKLPIKSFPDSCNLDDYIMTEDVIDVDNVVGFASNHAVSNWYEAIDSKVLHKPETLRRYNPDSPQDFDKFLISKNYNDPPSVIEIGGEYYVYGNGTHRLTIAKVLGNKKAWVCVRRIKEKSQSKTEHQI